MFERAAERAARTEEEVRLHRIVDGCNKRACTHIRFLPIITNCDACMRPPQERSRRRAQGLSSDESNDPSCSVLEGSSGVWEGRAQGDVKDYFEHFPPPAEDASNVSRGRRPQILGAEMLRRPLNMPSQMQKGKVGACCWGCFVWV